MPSRRKIDTDKRLKQCPNCGASSSEFEYLAETEMEANRKPANGPVNSVFFQCQKCGQILVDHYDSPSKSNSSGKYYGQMTVEQIQEFVCQVSGRYYPVHEENIANVIAIREGRFDDVKLFGKYRDGEVRVNIPDIVKSALQGMQIKLVPLASTK